MKKLVTILLCLCLVGVSFSQDKPTPPPEKESVLMAFLIVSAAVVGIIIIIKVNSTQVSNTNPVTLVLQKSFDNGTWINVKTNTVILNGLKPIEAFNEEITDPVAFYRVRQLKQLKTI